MTRITAIRFVRVRGTWRYEGVLGEGRSASPAHTYPEMRPTRRRWPIPSVEAGPPYPVEALFLFIDTDAGVSGCYGPLPESEAQIIAARMADILIGENPHAVERICDKLYRSNVTGRKGEIIQAISKVDLALWDLKGKLLGVPVYILLGGPTRDRVPAYASMLGYDQTPERAAAHSAEAVAQGYQAIKWFLSHTPQDGQEGIRRNLAAIRAVREAVGPDVQIMFDAWKSWDVPHTQRMAVLAAPHRPWWFEEPVMPDMVDQYVEIRCTVTTAAISGGEHEYTRWGIKALLDAGAVDILQPDPTWVGGLSETVKICALASTHSIPVVPHHGGRATLHLIAAQPRAACPIQEWLFQAGRRNNLFIQTKIEPVDGHFALPTKPGLVIELDRAAIESSQEITF